jgi:hypothetical protein
MRDYDQRINSELNKRKLTVFNTVSSAATVVAIDPDYDSSVRKPYS